MFELSSGFLALRMHLIPDRSALHVDDRLMPITPIRRSGQADNIACLDLAQDALRRIQRGDDGTITIT